MGDGCFFVKIGLISADKLNEPVWWYLPGARLNRVDEQDQVDPAECDNTRMVIVNTAEMISVSTTAGEAFGGFDWNEHQGKGVRLFIQGFG